MFHPIVVEDKIREQIERVIEFERKTSLRASDIARNSIFAANSALGRLQSGGTIKQVANAYGDELSRFANATTAKVKAVEKSEAAFEILARGFVGLTDELRKQYGSAVATALGQKMGLPRSASTSEAAERFWREIEDHAHAEFELNKFDFSASDAVSYEPPVLVVTDVSPIAAKKTVNRGGKPLAPHWDDMWSAIAVMLWAGDLKPKSQADIKRAMLDWFTDNGIEIGETAVTERARKLWQKIEAEQ